MRASGSSRSRNRRRAAGALLGVTGVVEVIHVRTIKHVIEHPSRSHGWPGLPLGWLAVVIVMTYSARYCQSSVDRQQ